jgi:hypothetical protein
LYFYKTKDYFGFISSIFKKHNIEIDEKNNGNDSDKNSKRKNNYGYHYKIINLRFMIYNLILPNMSSLYKLLLIFIYICILYFICNEKNNEQISNLRDNLTGVTTKISIKAPSSDSSKTSDWNYFNPEHFEINIRCGHKETKFKVKKKYTVSKVITKFIDNEKPDEKLEGKLLREGMPLKATDILGELGILENETLDLI